MMARKLTLQPGKISGGGKSTPGVDKRGRKHWIKKPGRVDIKGILADPVERRSLMAHTLQATQARERRDISLGRAYEVVDKVAAERKSAGTPAKARRSPPKSSRDPEVREILSRNGIPAPKEPLLEARWVAGRDDWYVRIAAGWLWLNSDRKTWIPCPRGPL